MTWCDKLASTPSIGIGLNPEYLPSSVILDALKPILKRARGDTKHDGFTIDSVDTYAVTLTTEDGFHYGVDSNKVFVEFRHRMRAKQISGGPPILEMLSRPLLFSQLMPEVSKRVLEAAELICSVQSRTIQRIGIVSSTSVDEEDAPPGILKFIDYVSKPWAGERPPYYRFDILADLGKTNAWSDRCLHVLLKQEESRDQLTTIRFDWQRSLINEKPAREEFLIELMRDAEKAALDYFEDLAIGNRFDA